MPLSVKPSLFVPMPTIWAYGALQDHTHSHVIIFLERRLRNRSPPGRAEVDQEACHAWDSEAAIGLGRGVVPDM